MLNIFPVLCLDAEKFTSFADVLLASPTCVELTFALCCFLKRTSCHSQLITQLKRHYRLIIPNVEAASRILKYVQKYRKLHARRLASDISQPNAFSKFPGSTSTICIGYTTHFIRRNTFGELQRATCDMSNKFSVRSDIAEL